MRLQLKCKNIANKCMSMFVYSAKTHFNHLHSYRRSYCNNLTGILKNIFFEEGNYCPVLSTIR